MDAAQFSSPIGRMYTPMLQFIFSFLSIPWDGACIDLVAVTRVARSWRAAIASVGPTFVHRVSITQQQFERLELQHDAPPVLARYVACIGGINNSYVNTLNLAHLTRVLPHLRALKVNIRMEYASVFIFPSHLRTLVVLFDLYGSGSNELFAAVTRLRSLVSCSLELFTRDFKVGHHDAVVEKFDFSILHAAPVLTRLFVTLNCTQTFTDRQLADLCALPHQIIPPFNLHHLLRVDHTIRVSPLPATWTSLEQDKEITGGYDASHVLCKALCAYLSHMTSLTRLSVHFDDESQAHLASLASLVRLTSLRLDDRTYKRVWSVDVLHNTLRELRELTKLSLTSRSLNSAELRILLPACPRLVHLALFHYTPLDSLQFLTLPSLAATLTHLHVNVDAQPENASYVCQLRALKILNLSIDMRVNSRCHIAEWVRALPYLARLAACVVRASRRSYEHLSRRSINILQAACDARNAEFAGSRRRRARWKVTQKKIQALIAADP